MCYHIGFIRIIINRLPVLLFDLFFASGDYSTVVQGRSRFKETGGGYLEITSFCYTVLFEEALGNICIHL